MNNKKSFQWTKKLTERFFHLRLQHDWLFKKKRQPWRDFYTILLKKYKYPSSMTINHIRKKWQYTFDEYQKAVRKKNKTWLYYDLFHQYLGQTKVLDKFESWSFEWRQKLINVYSNHYEKFHNDRNNTFEASDPWSEVERDLRVLGLPIESSVRQIPELWHDIIKSFLRKYKRHGKLKKDKYDWPLYYKMLEFYNQHDPEALDRMKHENLQRKTRKTMYLDDKSCLNENAIPGFDEDNDFQWSREWTESFIHIRLQNAWLFKGHRNSWKDMHTIMMQNGFPATITVAHLRRKWSTLNLEYQKALATGKGDWIYYDIFQKYIQNGASMDSLQNWPEEWVHELILSRTKNELKFGGNHIHDEGWRAVEADLRLKNIPVECSLLYIDDLWNHLAKTYKYKHKFALKGKLKENWPFYKTLEQYFEMIPKLKHEEKLEECQIKLDDDIIHMEENDDYNDIGNVSDDMFDDPSFEIPIKQLFKSTKGKEVCRACGSSTKDLVNIFDDQEEITYALKLEAVAGIEINTSDELPKLVCSSCLQELKNAYDFRIKCQNTDKDLRYNSSSKIEIEVLPTLKEENLKFESIADFDINDVDLSKKVDIHGSVDRNQNSSNTINKRKYIIKERNNDFETVDVDLIPKTEDDTLCSENEISNCDGFDDSDNEKLFDKISILSKTIKKVKVPTKSKSIKKPRRPPRRSKNVVFVTKITATGEKVVKTKYVYRQVCEICGKSTQKMKEHLKGHSTERPYKCPKCPKSFKYSSGLILHKVVHNDTPSKVCQLCGKEFKHITQYNRHFVHHANERKFACETCGKSFNTKDILRIHVRSHTDERPYSCNECGKSFRSSGCVSRHKRVHYKIHDITNKQEPGIS